VRIADWLCVLRCVVRVAAKSAGKNPPASAKKPVSEDEARSPLLAL
jgi:hypothetical protein